MTFETRSNTMQNVTDMFANNLNHLDYGSADFEVEMKPLMFTSDTSFGVKLNEVKKRAIVRTDTSQCLGVVGPNYNPVTHKEMINNQRAIISRSDLNIRGIEEDIITNPNGAKCFVKHTLPNQTITTPEGDTASLTFLSTNSFDGSFSFILSVGARQSACMNGQIFTSDSSTLYKSRHTRSLDIEKGARIITSGMEVMTQQQELWDVWYNTPVDYDMIANIFANTLGLDVLDLDTTPYNKNWQFLWDIYNNRYCHSMNNNLWAVYNALTHWATHAPSQRKTSSMLNVTKLRTAQVTKVISDPEVFYRQKLVA